MIEIRVPFINNNETEAKLVLWTVKDKSLVKKGDIIASFETTKAEIDFECEFDGKIKILGKPGNDYEFGEVIAFIYEDDSELDNLKETTNSDEVHQKSIITKPAREFMEINNISEEDVLKLGLNIVKTKDIRDLIKKPNSDLTIKIDARQVAIGKTVKTSVTSIPDAFQLKKIKISSALKNLDIYSKENKIVLGIPELIIYAISSLHKKHPYFFGKILENDFFENSLNPNIGITLDIGKGLFIPVIKESNKLNIKEIAKQLTLFKLKALRNSFKNEDLQNSNFTISLNMDKDTIFVKPIIFPGQTSMLSVNAIFKEVVLKNLKVEEEEYLNLGLAYDHRIINGFEANSFLKDLKDYIEGDFKLN
tara:strand:+ start:25909 stop:27000 length:1092 start_codon:yes stop_codon:yes gene_type:complete